MENDIEILAEQVKRQSRTNLLDFTLFTFAAFKPAQFHRHYYDILTKFTNGDIKKLMIFMPPQTGKTEGATRRLPAFLLGHNPDLRIGIISYSSTRARKFNREIQRIIDDDEYRKLFPETKLSGKNVVTVSVNALRNSEEFEIVGFDGSLKSVGIGGALTGDKIDILIIDDVYKDAMSAWSPVVRQNIEDWFDTVADTRLHNDSQILIVFTRWHEKDLAGRLLDIQGEFSEGNSSGWIVIKYPSIKIGEPTELDEREDGEPLWPERHSLEKTLLIKKRNPHIFESLYQQNPKPLQGLMYESEFKTYELLPVGEKIRKAYIDTADEGKDYLCAIVYDEYAFGNYVIDLLYTQKPMEYTEIKTAEMLSKHEVAVAVIESNNGGRGFARNVEKNLRTMENNKTQIKWFYQSLNKNVRIFVNSGEVQNLIYFPKEWQKLYLLFHSSLIQYMKVGKNEHDDAEDALTGTVEFRKKATGGKYVIET
ncbi:MAG: phage terminase large subunit [Actinobacteria bacterium]|nr:phage terminase large subunit [Actinomycetota bacterium]